MYAIVRSGGKQYKVAPNTVLSVEKVQADADGRYTFEDVLLVADEAGVRIGTPRVPDVKVTAEVLEQYRGKKVRGFTYKPKKNVQRRYGHRQSLTRVRVLAIGSSSDVEATAQSEE